MVITRKHTKVFKGERNLFWQVILAIYVGDLFANGSNKSSLWVLLTQKICNHIKNKNRYNESHRV